MSNNVQKTPFTTSLNRFAEQKAQSAIDLLGKALPCSVVTVVSSGIVTVKFEIQTTVFTIPNVTMPVGRSEYIRLPIQVGCKGVAFPADVYVGGMSGLGGGVASLTQPANLSALVFFPIGNTSEFAVDPNAFTAYGPNGCVLEDEAKKTTYTLTPTMVTTSVASAATTETINATSYTLSVANGGATLTMTNGSIVLSAAGKTVTINAAGVTIDGTVFDTHIHTKAGGTGISGPPVVGS